MWQETISDAAMRLKRLTEEMAKGSPRGLAVHFHLSRLKPYRRQPAHLLVAAGTLEALVDRRGGSVFRLPDDDLVVVFVRASVADAQSAISSLRLLFAADPLAARDDEDDGEDFCTLYELDQDMARFRAMVVARAEALAREKGAQDAREDGVTPLTPAGLLQLSRRLRRVDVWPLLRRQAIAALTPALPPTPIFEELYVSIAALRRQAMPGVALDGDRWLFQHLTQILDERLLQIVGRVERDDQPALSLNVNLSTILSPAFIEFDRRLRRETRKTIILEIQPIDILADMSTYLFARSYVQRRGYRICLDGLSHLTFPLADRATFRFDYKKLLWRPEMAEELTDEQRKRLAAAIAEAGDARVILARCDDARAVAFGADLGITLFQGNHVDRLLAAQSSR